MTDEIITEKITFKLEGTTKSYEQLVITVTDPELIKKIIENREKLLSLLK